RSHPARRPSPGSGHSTDRARRRLRRACAEAIGRSDVVYPGRQPGAGNPIAEGNDRLSLVIPPNYINLIIRPDAGEARRFPPPNRVDTHPKRASTSVRGSQIIDVSERLLAQCERLKRLGGVAAAKNLVERAPSAWGELGVAVKSHGGGEAGREWWRIGRQIASALAAFIDIDSPAGEYAVVDGVPQQQTARQVDRFR